MGIYDVGLNSLKAHSFSGITAIAYLNHGLQHGLFWVRTSQRHKQAGLERCDKENSYLRNDSRHTKHTL